MSARCALSSIASFAVLTLLADGTSRGAELSVQVVDDSSQQIPVRAWIDVDGKRFFRPSGPSTVTPYERDRSFSCDGEFHFAELPTGDAVVHIERGKEFRTVNHPVILNDESPETLKIVLPRWIDLPAEGWYSSDLHIHFGFDNPQVLAQLALADDVHVCPAFTYWYRGRETSWPADWPANRSHATVPIDAQHLLSYHNIEIERIGRGPGETVGASFLFNLTKPVTAKHFGEFFPTDAALILKARESSPLLIVDTDKPMWAETVVGAALGCYDTIQVCHNHYHRNVTLRGGFGMIEPLEDGESNSVVADGLFHRTNSLYYRFLNCGFRIAASGGSAMGVMGVPNGYNRTYALVDGNLTEENYWRAVKAGRTIATSGPILTMQVNGQNVGSTVEMSSVVGRPLTVTAALRLRSIQAIEGVQLIQNGRIIETIDLRRETLPQKDDADAPPFDWSKEFEVPVDRSGFIAARSLFRAPDGLLRQAHTSPVYVTLDGHPTASAEDARYMIEWIDRLKEIAQHPNRYPDDDSRNAVLEIYDRARTEYVRLETTAQQIWND